MGRGVCAEGCGVQIISETESLEKGFARPGEGDGAVFRLDNAEASPDRSPGVGPEARPRTVLVVEDNRADVFLIERAFEVHKVPARMIVVDDGEQAIRFIESVDADETDCPDLVLLDLNLPKRTGAEVLRHLRSSNRCQNTPVIVFTSSDSAHDRKTAADLGVARYLRKPMKYEEFLQIGLVMNEILAARDAAGG